MSGGHRLPFNTHIPVTPVRTDLLRAVSVAAPPPLSSAANNASSCATTLTVGGASLAALPATSVTLTSAPFPVTIRTSTSAPSVQFMPIGTATTGGQAGARVAQTTIRYERGDPLSPFRLFHVSFTSCSNRHVKPAMTIPRPPVPSGVSSLPGSAIKYPTVGIGGSQSVATVTISKPLQVMSTGQVPQSIYKPVTITSQQVGPAAAPRQITPQQLQIQPAGQVRMGQRMTMSKCCCLFLTIYSNSA